MRRVSPPPPPPSLAGLLGGPFSLLIGSPPSSARPRSQIFNLSIIFSILKLPTPAPNASHILVQHALLHGVVVCAAFADFQLGDRRPGDAQRTLRHARCIAGHYRGALISKVPPVPRLPGRCRAVLPDLALADAAHVVRSLALFWRCFGHRFFFWTVRCSCAASCLFWLRTAGHRLSLGDLSARLAGTHVLLPARRILVAVARRR